MVQERATSAVDIAEVERRGRLRYAGAEAKHQPQGVPIGGTVCRLRGVHGAADRWERLEGGGSAVILG